MSSILSEIGWFLLAAVIRAAESLLSIWVIAAVIKHFSGSKSGPLRQYTRILMAILAAVTLLALILCGLRGIWFQGLLICYTVCVPFLLSWAAYSLLLLGLLPLLRKRHSAETISLLWTLPILSFAFVAGNGFLPTIPKLLIGRSVAWILLAVWAAGFLVLMGREIWVHFRMRRRLLRNAEPVSTAIQGIYGEERRLVCGLEGILSVCSEKQVYFSPDADSPVAIGVFKRTTRIILPKRAYTEEELRLILRHELLHLRRRDNRMKLYLTLYYAILWFLPPTWLGLKRAAEDMELCCDELAVSYSASEMRKRYAEVLLTNAGSAQGFSTCLSATASGLRYRMQRVLHPIKRRKGILLVILFCLLFNVLAMLMPSPAVEAGTVGQTVLRQYPDSPMKVNPPYDYTQEWKPCDTEALREELQDVRLYETVVALNEFQLGEMKLRILLADAAELQLYEHGAMVREVILAANGESSVVQTYYYYETAPDWTAISRLTGIAT